MVEGIGPNLKPCILMGENTVRHRRIRIRELEAYAMAGLEQIGARKNLDFELVYLAGLNRFRVSMRIERSI